MFSAVLKAVAFYAFSWIVWKIRQRFFRKSALDNIPGPPAKSLWKGVLPQVFNDNAWTFQKEMAEKYGGVVNLTGLLGDVQLYVFDPIAMNHIVVKDTNTYEEATSIIAYDGLMSENVVWMWSSGSREQHRKQRKMLNPVFSIAHMRQMVPTFYNVADKLGDAIAKKVKAGPQEWIFSFDPLTEDGIPHPYTAAAKQVVPLTFKFLISRIYLLPILIKIGTPKLRRFFVNLAPWKDLRDLRDLVDVLHKTTADIIETKKAALAEGDKAVARQIGQGKDILSILLRANMSASKEGGLSEEELGGQISTLTFAAMDTTSSALSRTLWLLANHQDVQDRLRAEVQQARTQGDPAYDELVHLPYLDVVCRETLRLCVVALFILRNGADHHFSGYPPITVVARTTRQDSVLPLSNPIKGVDGNEMHEIIVPKDTDVFVSILSSNRNSNPEIWGPDSYEWKPERWLTSMPDAVVETRVPGVYSHLWVPAVEPFLSLSNLQQIEVVLSVLIASFKFSPSNKEVVWKMTGIVTPTTAGNKTPTPELPLVVELVA
ncbi:unnamed protein product [Cyclocybe aegerita]|uniref:Cytochrome P450 n=1 Tax=Cyclocybe aegerita TaxID=1973307 RepID=A0A8S0VYP8_CYCAE|nr:unnamed protein product [Cyclocybe aegerita]